MMIFSGSKPSERVNYFSISSLSLGAFGLTVSPERAYIWRGFLDADHLHIVVGVDLVAHHVLDVVCVDS